MKVARRSIGYSFSLMFRTVDRSEWVIIARGFDFSPHTDCFSESGVYIRSNLAKKPMPLFGNLFARYFDSRYGIQISNVQADNRQVTEMSSPVHILGISSSNHDRSACLVRDGRIISAISEERLDRRKMSDGFYSLEPKDVIVPPIRAIKYVLEEGGISLSDLDLVVAGRSIKPCGEDIIGAIPVDRNRYVELPLPSHHYAHAYTAAATSPFEEAMVMVIDEQGHHLSDGRFESHSWFHWGKGELVQLGEVYGSPERLSLGMFFNLFSFLLNLSEASKPSGGKLMGLASLGKSHSDWPLLIETAPDSADAIVRLDVIDSFFENLGLPIHPLCKELAPSSLQALLRKYIPIGWRGQLSADLAYKAQQELQSAVMNIAKYVRNSSDIPYLAYSGGVALNCVANRHLTDVGWDDVFVHPAASDDGNSVGLAMWGWRQQANHTGRAKLPKSTFSPFLGRKYGDSQIAGALEGFQLDIQPSPVSSSYSAARDLVDGRIVGWFQGGSEWGPRALGNRSILANPMDIEVFDHLNSRVKFRESFRPFGICGLEDSLKSLVYDWEQSAKSLRQYMLTVGELRDPRYTHIAHVDGSVRYQSVSVEMNPSLYELLLQFRGLTGAGFVINTSFNTLGDPLAETPADALRCFFLSEMDVLYLGDTRVDKRDLSCDVLEFAVSRAWSQTTFHPVNMAAKLHALGYTDKAMEVLSRRQYSSQQALLESDSVHRAYWQLIAAAARLDGDTEAERIAKAEMTRV